MSARLSIEVCYALANEQTLIAVDLPEGATLQQALDASGILQRYPQIDLGTQKVGVFGKLKPLDTVLADHDRVEIYRPLLVDPKLSRQRRVEKTRKAGSIEGRRWQNKDSR
ncbi:MULTISPECIES: RnfH family protein [Paraburkholderia]|jgi:putative ubiquitin-RnfH superfamily antitoxin RatB of RatAB toxin-antitoxin module|uniref:RnfH family protein n=1 Tax=Paraburkholderia TaxID=1822464 RepID=UPI0004AAC73C|nr:MULTISPECIES: RnfH family protein [Paraburkholderia]KFX61312.1 protein RnfH [Burkholderia sp. K24]MBU7436395.1 RnfH family protein [Paraburkholderia fungorum]MDE1008934.1 RnfH family protein [Paraburkholderia fungorum]PZR46950.1 MAG: RnfH family protein [Paraburkholderia fungorum]USX07129.1 RnfH family protein [Paraburkholderia fungorum]